jgi:hypothetical protein
VTVTAADQGGAATRELDRVAGIHTLWHACSWRLARCDWELRLGSASAPVQNKLRGVWLSAWGQELAGVTVSPELRPSRPAAVDAGQVVRPDHFVLAAAPGGTPAAAAENPLEDTPSPSGGGGGGGGEGESFACLTRVGWVAVPQAWRARRVNRWRRRRRRQRPGAGEAGSMVGGRTDRAARRGRLHIGARVRASTLGGLRALRRRGRLGPGGDLPSVRGEPGQGGGGAGARS